MPISPPGSPLLGADRPRVELRPATIAYTLGPEAVELSARAGLVLEQWQVDGLELMLSVRDDGLWACFEYVEMLARQNGKTTGLFAPRALAGMFLLEERLITWSAHEVKTVLRSHRFFERLLKRLGRLVAKNLYEIDNGDDEPILVKVDNTNGEEGFERLDTGQELRFIARSKGSGRGWDPDVQLHDEAFAYTREQQSAQAPAVNARPNPQICYASSPPLDSDSGDVLYALRERAEEGDESLGFRDWGLGGDLDRLRRMEPDKLRAFLDDRRRWAATNPALGRGRMTEESILRNRRAMHPIDFAREILGVWPPPPTESGQLIATRVWDQLADEASEIPDGSLLVFAIDANPERTRASIATAGRRDDELTHVEVIEDRHGLHWVVKRASDLEETHAPVWLMDGASPACSLLPELLEVGVEPLLLNSREFARACGSFFDSVEQGTLRHLGDPVLDLAVSSARKRDVGDGAWAWGRRTSAAHIAPLVAATLAAWGVTAHQWEAPEPAGVSSGAPAGAAGGVLSEIGF